MRTGPALLLTLIVGIALGYFLLGDPGAEAPEGPPRADPRDPPRIVATTGSLTIRVSTPDGSVPRGTEVGYVHRGDTRVLYADRTGKRQFTDAPLGALLVIARADGYEQASQPRTLLAGVPTEVRLILKPHRD